MNKNKLVVGPIGSGKTTNHLFKNFDEMIDNHESIVVINSNLEYLTSFKEKLVSENYVIKTINFKALTKSDKFNIFEYPFKLYQEKNYDEVMDILDSISKCMFEVEKSNDPFWVDSASDLFKCIVLSLFDKGDISNVTLDKVQDIVQSSNIKEYFDNIKDDSLAYRVGQYVIHAPIETRGGIISVCSLGLCRFTAREKLLNIISTNDIDVESFKDKKTAIFIVVDDIIKNNRIITNIFLYELFYSLYHKEHIPFNIIIDDINLVIPLENFDIMVKNSRNYNIFFNMSALDLDEFNNIYGEQTRKLFEVTDLMNKE